MSLHPQALPEVPAQTVVVAKAAFRRGNRYMLRRDELGTFYTDLDFAHLFAVRGQPAETSWRLALVLGFQCIGGGDAKRVTCPQEYTSQKWSHTHDLTGVPVINIRFAPAACASCPVRQQCTRSKTGPRKMTLQHKAEHEALQARREFQTTTVFQQQYNARAGIEGTISQSVRRTDIRHARYIGLAKTHLHLLLCTAAINLYRITNYIAQQIHSSGEQLSFAQTRSPAFVALAAAQ